uniref:Uncharacterized protein n=1 Tax=Aegilops tauschii subsp. strangulata TaxID=200361 RepID=A0A453NVH1_AEGTS
MKQNHILHLSHGFLPAHLQSHGPDVPKNNNVIVVSRGGWARQFRECMFRAKK